MSLVYRWRRTVCFLVRICVYRMSLQGRFESFAKAAGRASVSPLESGCGLLQAPRSAQVRSRTLGVGVSVTLRVLAAHYGPSQSRNSSRSRRSDLRDLKHSLRTPTTFAGRYCRPKLLVKMESLLVELFGCKARCKPFHFGSHGDKRIAELSTEVAFHRFRLDDLSLRDRAWAVWGVANVN